MGQQIEEPSEPSLQRAVGRFEVATQKHGTKTRLLHLRQEGCCRVLFPRCDSRALEGVMVNISGGLVAGDCLSGRVACSEGTHLVMSSQAHERVYKARSVDPATQIHITCSVEAGARLDWLPHGTIFYDRSHFYRHVSVDMSSQARLLFVDSRVFGRKAFGERIRHIDLRDRVEVRRDGRLIFSEQLKLVGNDIFERLLQSAVADGKSVSSTLIYIAPDAEECLDNMRNALEGHDTVEFACSAWNGMLIVRGLSEGQWEMDQALKRLIALVREDHPMPSSWRL